MYSFSLGLCVDRQHERSLLLIFFPPFSSFSRRRGSRISIVLLHTKEQPITAFISGSGALPTPLAPWKMIWSVPRSLLRLSRGDIGLHTDVGSVFAAQAWFLTCWNIFSAHCRVIFKVAARRLQTSRFGTGIKSYWEMNPMKILTACAGIVKYFRRWLKVPKPLMSLSRSTFSTFVFLKKKNLNRNEINEALYHSIEQFTKLFKFRLLEGDQVLSDLLQSSVWNARFLSLSTRRSHDAVFWCDYSLGNPKQLLWQLAAPVIFSFTEQ